MIEVEDLSKRYGDKLAVPSSSDSREARLPAPGEAVTRIDHVLPFVANNPKPDIAQRGQRNQPVKLPERRGIGDLLLL